MRKGKKAYKAKKAKGVVRIKKGEVRIKRAKAKLKAGYNPQTGRLTGRQSQPKNAWRNAQSN
jgi:hypothetical protein